MRLMEGTDVSGGGQEDYPNSLKAPTQCFFVVLLTGGQ